MILGLSALCAQAQFYFNSRHTLNSFTSIFTSVLPLHGKYYCTGLSLDSSNHIGGGNAAAIFGVRFTVFSESGAKLRDTIYQLRAQDVGAANARNIDPWFNHLQPSPDGHLLFTAESRDSVGTMRVAIIKMDTLGHVLMHKEYDAPPCVVGTNRNFFQARDLKPDGYGNWIMLSTTACQSPQQTDLLLTKLDSSFSVIWHRQLVDVSISDESTKLIVEPDGYTLAGGRSNSWVSSYYVWQAQLNKRDTAGNPVWTWHSSPSQDIISATDVVRTADGGYLYCGAKGEEFVNGFTHTMLWKGWIEKLDANRVSQWSKTIGNLYSGETSTQQHVIRKLPNGDFVVTGALIDSVSPNWIERYASLMRLAPDGTTKWHRRYSIPGDTFRYFINDMKPTPDGGFVLVGESTDHRWPYEFPSQRAWIVKVDSNGCASNNDPQCWPTAVESIPPREDAVLVYPNPATSVLTVRYASKAGQAATLYITDLTGRKVLQSELKRDETPLGISHLQPGLYLWRITGGGPEKAHGKFVKD